MTISQTGLWWNVARNIGYSFGLTGEMRARAQMHAVDMMELESLLALPR
jgi:hypothetical protein